RRSWLRRSPGCRGSEEGRFVWSGLNARARRDDRGSAGNRESVTGGDAGHAHRPRGALGMSRVRVLIADDRPIFRAGVQGMLRDFPEIDIVGEAVTGRQAVEHSRRLKPDVILMDLNMPE